MFTIPSNSQMSKLASLVLVKQGFEQLNGASVSLAISLTISI